MQKQTTAQAQAVIFDMDGVIVDSEPRHEQAVIEIVRELGLAHHGLNYSDYLGRTDHELFVDFLAKNKVARTLDELMELKRRRIIEIIRREQPVFKGLPELIEKLAPHYRLGLASGSERLVIEEVLALGTLKKFFGAAVSAVEVKRGKPAPDIFLRAAELLDVQPADCWVVEDSKAGIEAGLAAGMGVIAIANSHPPNELNRATHVVRTYEEIAVLLLRA